MIGLFDGMGFKSQFVLGDIQQIRPERSHEDALVKCSEVVLRDGQQLRLADFEVGILMERPVQIMPATDGYAIVGLYHDLDTYLTPIVGWALCLDGEVRPITPYGVHSPEWADNEREVYIQTPGGLVYNASQGNGIYDSVDDLVSEIRANRRHRAAIAERSAQEASA